MCHSNSKLNFSGNDIACERWLPQITLDNQEINGVIIKIELATMTIELMENTFNTFCTYDGPDMMGTLKIWSHITSEGFVHTVTN